MTKSVILGDSRVASARRLLAELRSLEANGSLFDDHGLVTATHTLMSLDAIVNDSCIPVGNGRAAVIPFMAVAEQWIEEHRKR